MALDVIILSYLSMNSTWSVLRWSRRPSNYGLGFNAMKLNEFPNNKDTHSQTESNEFNGISNYISRTEKKGNRSQKLHEKQTGSVWLRLKEIHKGSRLIADQVFRSFRSRKWDSNAFKYVCDYTTKEKFTHNH